MSTSTTSIGPEGHRGGNDSPGNADGVGNKTLGEGAAAQPAAGAAQVLQPGLDAQRTPEAEVAPVPTDAQRPAQREQP